MLPTLTDLPDYSTDIWEYLGDMPYMPSRKDRDSLVKEAARDPSRQKRVALWDYFFRIRKEDLGKLQKKELAELEKKVSESRQRLNDQIQKLNTEKANLLSEREKLQEDSRKHLGGLVQGLENEHARLLGERDKLNLEVQKYLAEQTQKLKEEQGRLAAEREKIMADTQRFLADQLIRLEDERTNVVGEIEKAKGIRQQFELGAERQAVEQLSKGISSKRTFGIIALLASLPFMLGICWGLLITFNALPWSTEAANGPLLMLLCCSIGVPLFIFAVWQLIGARGPSQQKIDIQKGIILEKNRVEYEQHVGRLNQAIQQIPGRMDAARAEVAAGRTPYAKRLEQNSQSIQQVQARIDGVSADVAAGRSPLSKRIEANNQAVKQAADRVAAARLDVSAGRTPQDRRLAEVESLLQIIPEKISAATDEFDSTYPPYSQRVMDLHAKIDALIAQIPEPVSNDQVDRWLKEDIDALAETAADRSGLRDRLIPVLDAKNPFCIRGPAELQLSELIPMPYRDRNSDRAKHLRARQFVIMPDGTFADFYGVYNIEFILVAEDVLATNGTFYDFITGRQSGERTTGQHYIDVVTIRTMKGYREVETDNNEKISMENVPSLSLSLVSGDKIDVTFPDDDYFRQINATGFGQSIWRFDPRMAADNAIKVVREKVDEAKRKN